VRFLGTLRVLELDDATAPGTSGSDDVVDVTARRPKHRVGRPAPDAPARCSSRARTVVVSYADAGDGDGEVEGVLRGRRRAAAATDDDGGGGRAHRAARVEILPLAADFERLRLTLATSLTGPAWVASELR